MRNLMRGCVLLTVAALVACASAPPPAVSVSGAKDDVRSLVGEWSGQYTNPGVGRSGVIRFTLAADGAETSAFGDVVMFADGGGEPGHVLSAANERQGGPGAQTQVLSIRFVRVAGDVVSGTMEPYRDPDCGCVLSTTFTGVVRGGVIEGTFLTFGGPAHLPQMGNWRAERKVSAKAK